MQSATQRLLAVVAATVLLVAIVAALYMAGMSSLEERPRDYSTSLMWAAETLTTTGYGGEHRWEHPLMVGFVILTQFSGVALTFLTFSLLIIPYFQRRLEGRLPQRPAAKLRDYIVVYRFGPAVSSLIDELHRSSVPTVVLEEDETVARRLAERGRNVVLAALDTEDPDPGVFSRARAIVANGTDQQNAALILVARQQGYKGEIVALAERPLHRRPMMLAGATAVYTPLHILAAAMASLASERISPRVSGLGRLGGHLHTMEVRISPGSELAGKSLAEADVRARTGTTIIGQWHGGTFAPRVPPDQRLDAGRILLAIGSATALERLGKLATPLQGKGAFVVCGYGEVGRKVTEFLRDAGEEVVVLDREAGPAVDVVGDALDQAALEQASVKRARAVVLALGDDSTTLFAASVVRDFAHDVPILARVNRADHVERIHRAGADFALSLSEVAAELLAQKLLGADWLSLEARVKLEKAGAGDLVGASPTQAEVGRRTQTSIVAVERDGDVTVEFDRQFRIQEGDVLYIAGSEQSVQTFFEVYPGSRL